jgi:hypothetical protein
MQEGLLALPAAHGTSPTVQGCCSCKPPQLPPGPSVQPLPLPLLEGCLGRRARGNAPARPPHVMPYHTIPCHIPDIPYHTIPFLNFCIYQIVQGSKVMPTYVHLRHQAQFTPHHMYACMLAWIRFLHVPVTCFRACLHALIITLFTYAINTISHGIAAPGTNRLCLLAASLGLLEAHPALTASPVGSPRRPACWSMGLQPHDAASQHFKHQQNQKHGGRQW